MTEKCYNFEVNTTIKAKGYIFARNEAEAINLINSKQWDEITVDYKSMENITVKKIKEDLGGN